MELFRNVEVVLMLCFGFLCGAALTAEPSARYTADEAGIAVGQSTVAVVVVTAKRLGAAGR